MKVFVDTSAFLAIVNVDDPNHTIATTTWDILINRGELLVATNYVLVETFALVQRRHGLPIVRMLQQAADAVLQTFWIDSTIHATGIAALFAANRRQLSLVDCISFEAMRRLGIDTVFAFDEHFVEQGFTCLPQQGNGV